MKSAASSSAGFQPLHERSETAALASSNRKSGVIRKKFRNFYLPLCQRVIFFFIHPAFNNFYTEDSKPWGETWFPSASF